MSRTSKALRIMAAVYALCLISQAEQVNCIKWKDVAGNTVGSYCKPFQIRAGNGIQFADDGYGKITITSTGTAPGAGGSDTQINFNASGELTGSSGLTFNDTTDTLTATHITGLDNKPYIDVVRDCGAVGDGTTDDATVVNACFAAHKGHHFHFPQTKARGSCSYKFNAFLYPQGSGTEITGESGGQYLNSGTLLCFAANTTGIWLDNTDCSGCTVRNISLLGGNDTVSTTPQNFIVPSATYMPEFNRAIASIQRATNVLTVVTTADNGYEGLTQQVGSIVAITGVVGDSTMNGTCVVASLTASGGTVGNPNGFTCSQIGSDSGPYTTDGTMKLATTSTNNADGIRVCGNFMVIDHVQVRGFARHGVNADTSPQSSPACSVSFSDDLIMRDSLIYSNQGYGFFCHGGNCNAGYLYGNAFYNNLLWGMYDIGTLPNAWTSNQASNNGSGGWNSSAPATKNISAISRTSGLTSVTLASADTTIKVGNVVVIAGVTDSSFNSTANSGFFVSTVTDSTHYQYTQPGNPADASSSGGTSRLGKFAEVALAAGVDNGGYKIQTNAVIGGLFLSNYIEGGQNCKFGRTIIQMPATGLSCSPSADWYGLFISPTGISGLPSTLALNPSTFANNTDGDYSIYLRPGNATAATARTFNFNFTKYDSTVGFQLGVGTSGTAGDTATWIVSRNSVRRLGFWGPNNSAGITRINSESTGAVELNNEPNTGTGGIKVCDGAAVPTCLQIKNSTASTVGSAGAASALPATPSGYLVVVISGTTFKIPYYAN